MKDERIVAGITINYEDGTATEFLDDRGGNGGFVKNELNRDGDVLKDRRVTFSTVKRYIKKLPVQPNA